MRAHRAWLGTALVLASCSGEATAPAPYLPPPVAVKITGVEPALGAAGGGTAVEIRGESLIDYLGDVRVSFGGIDADVQDATDTVVHVVTPPVDDGGLVDVEVANDYGSDTLPQAYTYEASIPLYGAYIDLYYLDVLNPDQFDPAYNDRVYGYAVFYEPQEQPLYTPPGGTDTCYFNGAPNYPEVHGLDAGPAVNLTLPGRTLLYTGAANEYEITGDGVEDPTWYTESGAYGLEAPGGTILDAFGLTDVLHPSGHMQVSAPAIDAYDPNSTVGYTTHDRNQDLPVTWVPSSSDQLYIELVGFDVDNNDVNEAVYCTVVDDGSFTIPGATIAMMAQTYFAAVYLTRVTVTEFDFAPTASIGQAAAWEADFGTLVLQ